LASFVSYNSLSNFTPGEDLFATGHFRLLQSGADTLFQVDYDGTAISGPFSPVYGFVTLVTFKNHEVGDFTAYNLAGYHQGVGNVFDGSNGHDTLTGTAFADQLYGDGRNDTLIGNNGDDTLDGGTGGDSMVGGAGDDVYIVDAADDVVVEDQRGDID